MLWGKLESTVGALDFASPQDAAPAKTEFRRGVWVGLIILLGLPAVAYFGNGTALMRE